ncbi:MAG: hypothetical protein M5U09_15540 [Gammaproteobacteria bacterium]|nr:hypothetical protein [Gammaproteobacteria bacterium]
MPELLRRYGTVLAFVLLVAVLSATADNFLDPYNLLSILKHVSFLAIIALGFTLALAAGELDLSIAHVASLASVCSAALLFGGHPVALAILAGIGTGTLIGIVNGLIVTRMRIPRSSPRWRCRPSPAASPSSSPAASPTSAGWTRRSCSSAAATCSASRP